MRIIIICEFGGFTASERFGFRRGSGRFGEAKFYFGLLEKVAIFFAQNFNTNLMCGSFVGIHDISEGGLKKGIGLESY